MDNKKTTQLEVYKKYVALKAHFRNESYDYFDRFGKTKATLESYRKRSDKYFFEKLSKNSDYFNYLLSNILEYDAWIGSIILDEKSEKIYKDFLRRKQSLTYIFSQDIKKLDRDLKSNFVVRNNSVPKLLELYCNSSISIETTSILIHIFSCKEYWDKNIPNDFLWNTYRLKLCKYYSFIEYNKSLIRDKLVDNFKK